MKYQWIEEDKTCEQLSEQLGCPVKSITKGYIIVGEQDGLHEDGKPAKLPITRRGIEIDFAKKPTAEQLARLDAIFPDLRRAGGRTVPDELVALKDRVKQVEDQLKESRG